MNKIFISGGAGFIGSNIAKKYLDTGNRVVVYDNLSRKDTEKNLKWLRSHNKVRLQFIKGDIRDVKLLEKSIKGSNIVFHEAAQVAVTLSLENPREDFEINAEGTFNMLEATRNNCPDAIFIYASTNKVYGELTSPKYRKLKTKYIFTNKEYLNGVSESQLLDFHSPYGCSKGTGDQYTRDYARVYGLKTAIFRQSCIYGQRQFGSEDQGWVIHFIRKALRNELITIYGDGKQVRDILHIDDLLDAYQKCINQPKICIGEIFNIGGGIENSLSLLELIEILGNILGKKIKYKFFSWREGDQKIYISDNTKIEKSLRWRPEINKYEGIKLLVDWAKTIK